MSLVEPRAQPQLLVIGDTFLYQESVTLPLPLPKSVNDFDT